MPFDINDFLSDENEMNSYNIFLTALIPGYFDRLIGSFVKRNWIIHPFSSLGSEKTYSILKHNIKKCGCLISCNISNVSLDFEKFKNELLNILEELNIKYFSILIFTSARDQWYNLLGNISVENEKLGSVYRNKE